MEVCCVGTWIWRSEMLARSPSTAPSGLCDLHKSLDGSEPRSPPLRESLGACSGRAPVGRSLSSGRQRALPGGQWLPVLAPLCPSPSFRALLLDTHFGATLSFTGLVLQILIRCHATAACPGGCGAGGRGSLSTRGKPPARGCPWHCRSPL